MMQRRDFLRVVGTGAAVVAVYPSMIGQTLYADDGQLYKAYEKVQLVGSDGSPIKASTLEKEKTYVFNYPHVAAPCFLINLPEKADSEVKLKSEDGIEYIWSGAVGKDSSIVAYTAICPHQLTHINKVDSFISYVPKAAKTMAYTEGGVIVCASHLSAFDPKRGAVNLSGPAPQPLASIVLEHAKDDTLWAVAVLGQDKFHEYFKSFRSEFKEQWGGKRKAKKLVSFSAPTVVINEYTKDVIQY